MNCQSITEHDSMALNWKDNLQV
uniref:Uncharacterized protein n=1 Tax=Arundo donax TaxID=35708 RepID=A0A0A9AQH6_ARUDO